MAVAASLGESMQVSAAIQRWDDRFGGKEEVPPPQQKAVGFCQKVMLVLVMCGMEMFLTFEQIYQILILQYLGVPLSLVSLTGIICGVASITAIPILGYLTDRGSNPKRRRMVLLFVGMGMFQIGLFLLLICGLLKISLIQELLKDVVTTTPALSTAGMADITNVTELYRDELLCFNRTSANLSAELFNITCGNYSVSDWNQTNLTTDMVEPSLGGLMPLAGYLSICGFAIVDIGFDTSIPIIRSYILESVPKFQHVKLLVMATIVQSASGTVFALLGVLDISAALGNAFMVDGTSAILIFFCAFLILVVTGGFTSTILTGYYLTRDRDNADKKLKACAPSLITQKKIVPEECFLRRNNSYKAQDDSKVPLLNESTHDNNYSALNVSSSFRSSILNLENSAKSEKAHFSYKLHRSMSNEDKGQSSSLRSSYSLTNHETETPNFDCDNKCISSIIHEDDSSKVETNSIPVNITTSVQTSRKEIQDTNNNSTETKSKIKLAILSTSTFLSVGVSTAYLYYAPNALTIGIFHGDPTALPGTEGNRLYQEGLRTASLGNLTFYILFTITSLTNHKLLDLVGEKVLFVVFHLMFLVPLSALLITQCIEAYFATVVMVGLFRHTGYTLIYVMASKLSSQEAGDGTKKSNLGKIVTLLGFLTAAHYLLLSAMMGPLIEATGNVWIPLVYSLVCGCLSISVFSLLWVVK